MSQKLQPPVAAFPTIAILPQVAAKLAMAKKVPQPVAQLPSPSWRPMFLRSQIAALKLGRREAPNSSPSPRGRGQGEGAYADVPGFCKSAALDEIRTHGHVLTPGRYVGAEEVEDDGEPFDAKMRRLTTQLADQFAESTKLEKAIRKHLSGLGFSLGGTP